MTKTMRLHEPRQLGLCQQTLPGTETILGTSDLRKYVRPVAEKLEIQKSIDGTRIPHAIEKRRHRIQSQAGTVAPFNSAVHIGCTQAITPAKHAAPAAVLSLVFSRDAKGTSQPSSGYIAG
jgi:hypothetical protein